jgi:opacity protein-like surface antigen
MKVLMGAVLAAALLGSASAAAERTARQVGRGTENVGRTVAHGATAVGKGATRVFHLAGHRYHKTVGKNTGHGPTERAHLRRAERHHRQARRKAKEYDRSMTRAGHAADRVTD